MGSVRIIDSAHQSACSEFRTTSSGRASCGQWGQTGVSVVTSSFFFFCPQTQEVQKAMDEKKFEEAVRLRGRYFIRRLLPPLLHSR